jgi:4-amino-4-deoxy-L-arabinose transferase-like glycosyltransferase
LGIILAVAVALRFLDISSNSLWFDEAFSWLVARQPSLPVLIPRLGSVVSPLYHFLLHFWVYLGESELALRSFSAMCGLLAVLVVYGLGQELFAQTTGLAAALLMAVLPFHIYYSQEARPYALIILLSALMLLSFVRAWKGASYRTWLVLGVVAALNIYAHYFSIFTLAVLHVFVLLTRTRDRRAWQGLLLADLVALALVGPHLPTAWAQTQQVTSSFWIPVPSPFAPIKTLDYMLFSQTTPISLVPVALFLTLSIFILVTWAAIRAYGEVRQRMFLLLALILVPIFVVLVLSWLTGPVYLDRAFSLVTPAYVLLLAWGLAHPSRGSPVRLLYGGLILVVVASLGNHYLKPDPAKPPFREVGAVVQECWQAGDVLFHLHDSSYLPLLYYAPETGSYLLKNDSDPWLPPNVWKWAGRRVSALDEIVTGKKRLWVVIVPSKLARPAAELLNQVEAHYVMENRWTWDSVELRLYNLQEATVKAPIRGMCDSERLSRQPISLALSRQSSARRVLALC